MKYGNKQISVGREAVMLAIAFVLCALAEPAYCQIDGPVLLLQQTPAEGGIVTPEAGVHQYELNTTATLTAIPEAGYQFVYWLGDVRDAVASSTTVHVDGPKIIIAVFEKFEFDPLLAEDLEWTPTGAPIGGLIASGADYSRRGFSGGGRGPGRIILGAPEPPEVKESDDFPVPGEDFPVPVPEPTTVWLLGVGGWILLRKRSGNKSSNFSKYPCRREI